MERRIAHVLAHGKYIMDTEVGELEEKLSAYTGVKHCVAVGNSTDALMIALGVQLGDEIVTSPFTFIGTAEAAGDYIQIMAVMFGVRFIVSPLFMGLIIV